MSNQSISYEEARTLARNGEEKERRDLAARPDVRPEILYFLADDPSAEVRRCLANNEATPRQADVLLANDKEDQVRQDLASKIAKLVPDLDSQEQERVYLATMETLEILVRDQTVKVRQILADTLKDVAGAPPSIINRLARDAEIVVAEPVLMFSPVLSNDDLLDIITSNPVDGALSAIAQRSEVGESVVDAIVEADDYGAVALLLGNSSAQIREETLDQIIDKAPDVESWHLPLVERPKLPFKAAFKLAHFVAENLVDALRSRGDLDVTAVEKIREIVEKRIDDGTMDPDWANEDRSGGDDVVDVDDLWDEEDAGKKKKGKPVTPIQIARDMAENGRLNEKSVTEALDRGDIDLVIAAIAVLSELDMAVVEKAMDSHSAVSVMAVCREASLSAKLAEQVQTDIAGIKGDDVVKPKGRKYAVSKDELASEVASLKAGGE